jgi:predicted nuclease of predicted toxin-antitoxin system
VPEGVLLFLADENFNNDIVRGLLRRQPSLDIVRAQDVGLSGSNDPKVLEWAAQANRVLLTHDVTTITRFAMVRVVAGQPMPGVVEVSRSVPIGIALDDIQLLAETSRDGEWDGLVLYLPLR